MDYMCYADDTQLYMSVGENSHSSVHTHQAIVDCVADIRKWMLMKDMKLNDAKTELIHLSSRYRHERLTFPISVGEIDFQNSNSVSNLGIIFDRHMILEDVE